MGHPKKGEGWSIALVELSGTLGMVQSIWWKQDLYTSEINIWLLADTDKSIWTREYTIQMPKTAFLVRVLDLLGYGRVLLLTTFVSEVRNKFLLIGKKSMLQLFDPNTRTSTDLVEMSDEFRDAMALYTGDFLS